MNVPMTMNMLPIKAAYQCVEYSSEIKIVAALIFVIQVANNQLGVGKVTNLGAINVLMTINM